MKTYQDFIELNEPEEINEISLKTLSSVAITARLRAVQNKISSLTIRSSNDVEDNLVALGKKIELLASMNMIIGVLVSQTSIMKGSR
jgi:hypothetical protein